MNFIKICLFLAVFAVVWMAIFGFEKALAYGSFNNSNLFSDKIEKTREIERIRGEIERIRGEIERIRKEIALLKIEKEIERIRGEIVLLEKEISPEKITTSTKEITILTKEKEEIEQVEEKPVALLAGAVATVRRGFGDFERVLTSYFPWWLILILASYPLARGIIAWRKFKKESGIEKPKSSSLPTFFLLVGILITIFFTFVPRIYDPVITKIFATESIVKNQHSIDYLYSSQNQNNIINGVNRYKIAERDIVEIIPATIFSSEKILNLTKMFNYLREDYYNENQLVNSIIKTTWFVFILFFLFPIAVMLPLHWYERGKIRRTEKKIPDSPKVSLILPAYNEEKFIQKSIEQGLRQDYKGEIEIVIIDDGSIDRTFEIAQKYAEMYSNVKIYRHGKNRGKPAGLNTGFQKATGEISIFSDTDSHLDFDLVSRMVPHFDDPKVGAVAGMIIIDNEINLLTKLQQIEYLYNQEIIRFCQSTHKGVLICPGAATAVRTEIAREIPSTERTITEDADFTFEVAKAGWKISQEPEAISRTDAPENWKELINQRKRWLYGVLQTIWLHKWALFYKDTKIPNLWVWWAWIGYITCPITVLAVIAMPLFIKLIGISYLIFLGFYSTLIGAIFVFAHWYGIKQYTHTNKTKLTLLLPIYMVYQYILNVLLFYLVVAFILRKGITVRYGGRDIHAV